MRYEYIDDCPSIVDGELYGVAKAPPIWMQALGSVAFDLLSPKPEQIDFATIATVLARVPRFGGHTERGAYSVAQHCEQGAQAILRDTGNRTAAAAFLLHDAHEAYVGDFAKPVQDALVAAANETGLLLGTAGNVVRHAISTLKSRLDSAIYTAAGLPWPLPADVSALVHEYDIRMCRTERDVRLAPTPHPWGEPYASAVPVAGVDLYPWSEGAVRAMWLALARELLPSLRENRLTVNTSRDSVRGL